MFGIIAGALGEQQREQRQNDEAHDKCGDQKPFFGFVSRSPVPCGLKNMLNINWFVDKHKKVKDLKIFQLPSEFICISKIKDSVGISSYFLTLFLEYSAEVAAVLFPVCR